MSQDTADFGSHSVSNNAENMSLKYQKIREG
jgi:hypothetical protein